MDDVGLYLGYLVEAVRECLRQKIISPNTSVYIVPDLLKARVTMEEAFMLVKFLRSKLTDEQRAAETIESLYNSKKKNQLAEAERHLIEACDDLMRRSGEDYQG